MQKKTEEGEDEKNTCIYGMENKVAPTPKKKKTYSRFQLFIVHGTWNQVVKIKNNKERQREKT